MNRYLLLALLPIALTACASSSSPKASDASVVSPPAASAAISSSRTSDTHVKIPGSDAYHWQLSDARNAQGRRIDTLFVRDDKPVQLDFRGGRINVSNTCNNMMGGYSVEGDRMTIPRMASTMRACPDPRLMALDGEVSSRLDGVLTFAMHAGDPPMLILTTITGDKLTFTGEPTAETRYGGAGETVFLEIAAETKPCPHPLIPDAQCLQVREVYYDDNGLKSRAPGEWRNFFQQIEGYTHQPGIRNVVRAKRYRIANPPADASSTAYVLDMVIESEIVNPPQRR
ncbi:MAG: META and DUF4377 domain-containing protein [Xanthomonadaceae bacterium]|jgi:heat shock protein HslJ|nr:META and DUF4377 domain-containing protein [Xanthomonadaceae bacterium]